jgi:hypothetical protein
MAKIIVKKLHVAGNDYAGYAGLEYGINTTLAEDIPFTISTQFGRGFAIPITFKGTVAKATNTDPIEGFVDPQQVGELSTINADYPKTGDHVKLDQVQVLFTETAKTEGTPVYLDDDGELNDTAGTNVRQIGVYKLDKTGNMTYDSVGGLSKTIVLDPRRFDV